MMREPSFWWHPPGTAARALAPVSAVYGAVAQARLLQRGVRVATPVVCVGNPTVGGAGKTPTALTVARILKEAGELPVFLTRGHGGTLAGPIEVDPAHQHAAQVGDEPLLLARVARTIVARARLAGAGRAAAAGASVIVMDDGFQNPSLHKDFSLLVVDGRRGIGNGRVIPGGPLRAPLAAQLARAHALLLVGAPLRAGSVVEEARRRDLPVLRAHLRPDPKLIAALGRGRVLAFAGIGDPEKFFATLADAGVAVAVTRSFPDHHRYTHAEARALCEEADREGLMLVTTEKDLVRLEGDEEAAGLAAHAHALPVALVFEQEATFKSLLLERIAAARKRDAAGADRTAAGQAGCLRP
jgi:tetraacyldisaccharide 4'-kinase